MARKRARNPLRWLRYLLLAAGVAVVCGVVVLILAYRFGRVDEGAEVRVANPEDEGEILVGTGFEYTQTGEDAVPIFRIAAEHSRQDADGTAHLEEVLLEIFRADDTTYTVTSDRATFNEEHRQARLEGHVLLKGFEDLELDARSLELRQEGRQLISDGPVEFRYPPDFEGRASGLRFDRFSDTIQLSGGVHIRSTAAAVEPVRLDAERITFQRRSGLIRAKGGVSLTGASERLESHYLTVFLGENGKDVAGVRARWRVRGHLDRENAEGRMVRLEYQGYQLEARPRSEPSAAAAVRRKVTLFGDQEDPARLTVTDDTGVARTLIGQYLVGEMRNEKLLEVNGTGEPLTLTEFLDVDPPWILRQACAERLHAGFRENGELSQVFLESQVELSDPPLNLAGGSQATMDFASGQLRIDGPAVELRNDRLDVVARQYSYTQDNGVLRASGGVQTTLSEGSLSGLGNTPLGQGSGPIRVESDEAVWTVEPSTFSFRGQVRAWRDQSLLLADQLRGDEGRRELAASGHLKTVWRPTRDRAGSRIEGLPIEVTSESMTYLEPERRLVYEGGVEMLQDRRTLSCQRLTVDLTAADHDAERMECAEEVRIHDPSSERRVEGERAVYTVDRDLVEVFGDKVLLFDAENNRIQGRYLLYDLAAGTVNLKSREPAGASPEALPTSAGPEEPVPESVPEPAATVVPETAGVPETGGGESP